MTKPTSRPKKPNHEPPDEFQSALQEILYVTSNELPRDVLQALLKRQAAQKLPAIKARRKS